MVAMGNQPDGKAITTRSLLTTRDLSRILNLHMKTIQAMARDGRLPPPARTNTRRRRWLADDISKFLEPTP